MNLRPPFRFTRPFARLNRMDWTITRRLLIIGTISMTLLAGAGLYIGLFGTVAVAASGIANQLPRSVHGAAGHHTGSDDPCRA